MLPVWYGIQRDTDPTPRVKAKCTIDSIKCHTKTKNYTVRLFTELFEENLGLLGTYL